jgi:hypothetical protein
MCYKIYQTITSFKRGSKEEKLNFDLLLSNKDSYLLLVLLDASSSDEIKSVVIISLFVVSIIEKR